MPIAYILLSVSLLDSVQFKTECLTLFPGGVSIFLRCSNVSLFPSTTGITKSIELQPCCDVTNYCVLYLGVVVQPEAIVGISTYGAPLRVFPSGCITQVRGTYGLHPFGVKCACVGPATSQTL
jgi:hypothetical protein